MALGHGSDSVCGTLIMLVFEGRPLLPVRLSVRYPLQSRSVGGVPVSGSSILGMATPNSRGRPSLGQGAPPSHMTGTRFPSSREGGAMRSPYQQPSQGGRPY